MQTQPAPPFGRQSQTFEVGGRSYRIHPLAPRAALRVAARLVGLLGEPLAGLFFGTGLDLGIKDLEGEPILITFDLVLRSQTAREAVFTRVLSVLRSIDPEEIGTLADSVIVGQVEMNMEGAWVLLTTGSLVDEAVATLSNLMVLLKHAFVVSLGPILADGDTSESPPAEGKPADPAAETRVT